MRVVDAGLYTLLNADATLVSLGSTGAYRLVAPQGATLPYVIFSQMSGVDDYTFDGRSGRSLLYQVKAVTSGQSASTAEQMAERIDAVLTDGSLSVSGWTVLRCRRESDVLYTETSEGMTYNHVGGLFRVDII